MTADDKFLAEHVPHRRKHGHALDVWLLAATWAALVVVLIAVGFSLYWR